MSDILIRGMEMPTSCAECVLNYDCFKCIVTGTPFFDREHNFDDETTRLDNCPLVPVPEHGRLIDADALMAEDRQIYRSDGAAIGRRRYIELYEIDDAPTIIPADPAEEGEG